MTSRNSFWASCKENHRRRIWVWIVACLMQAVSYVGVLTVYLSRIRMWNAEGSYKKPENFQAALYLATQDALGFQDNLGIVIVVLAAMIGMQGFSYLYDRKKVDMYHSVPVDKNRRFLTLYANGIMIYLAATLLNLFISVIMAMVQHAVNGGVMAVVGLGFVWNFLVFLVMYHTVILAVMLTGSRLITLCAVGVFSLYELVLYSMGSSMQYAFFTTKDNFYVSHEPKLSVLSDYLSHTWEIKGMEEAKEMAVNVVPFYGKWILMAVVILALAWVSYRKRPSEAAGKALAFPILEPYVKVLVVIPVAVCLGMWVYSVGYGSKSLAFVAMTASGVIACAVMEVIYDFDIKSMFKHLLSSGIAVAGIVIVFFIFKEDVFGYDKYIPAEEKLESVALVLDSYPDFWDEDFTYLSTAKASEERMYLKNTAPVLALAQRAQQVEIEDMTDPRYVHVLYRLKSGRRVGRGFHVDFADPDNETLLDQIVATKEYKEGTFQIMTDEKSFEQVQAVTYSNGAAQTVLPIEDALALREAYLKDMEGFHFKMARKNRPCGEISFRFPHWMTYTLQIYEGFENTIAYLQSKEAYYPLQLDPEDIASITVTNYHYELQRAAEVDDSEVAYDARSNAVVAKGYIEDYVVSETFYEEEQFAQIVPEIYPNMLSTPWCDYAEIDSNYDVFITFKKDTTYPYDRSSYGFSYQFFAERVPKFVDEATAMGADEE